MKIKMKSTLYILTSALFLETAIEIRQIHKRVIKLPITHYYFGTTCYKVFKKISVQKT